MKKILLLVASIFVVCLHLSSQAPQGIPYQAIVRDLTGNPIINQSMSARFTVHTGTSTGTIEYQEVDTPRSNSLGLIVVVLGGGQVVQGSFSGINWAVGPKYMQVEVDPTGGTSYLDMGTTQIASVPYALYSSNGLNAGTAAGNTSYWDGTEWVTSSNFLYNDGSHVGIANDTPATTLDIIGTIQTRQAYAPFAGTFISTNAGSLFGTPTPAICPVVPGAGSSYNDNTGFWASGVADLTQFGMGISNLMVSNTVSGISAVILDNPSGISISYQDTPNVQVNLFAGNQGGGDGGDFSYQNNNTNINEDLHMDANGINMNYNSNSGWNNNINLNGQNIYLGYNSNDGSGDNNFITVNNNNGAGSGVFLMASGNSGNSSIYIDKNGGVSVGSNNGGLMGIPNNGQSFFNGDLAIYTGPSGTSGSLTVNGNITTNGFQLQASPSQGYVLQSDNSGNGSWVDPSTLPVASNINIQSGSYTLLSTDGTVIFTGSGSTVAIPPAAMLSQHIYVIVNKTGSALTSYSYIDLTNSSNTSIPAYSSITIQAYGGYWQQIR